MSSRPPDLPNALRRYGQGIWVVVPSLVFGFVYTLAFVYAFSALQNFGILARERSQLLPALFVLLCIPKPVGPTSTSS